MENLDLKFLPVRIHSKNKTKVKEGVGLAELDTLLLIIFKTVMAK